MIEIAWNEYRAWAKRARELQSASQRWARWAIAFAVSAVVFGAFSGQTELGTPWTRALTFLAAACAAITPVLGKDILSVGRESQWIRARAAAETIKSECYRFAARAGDYAGQGGAELFRKRRDAAIEAATRAGLTPLADPVDVDKRRPSEPLDAKWYLSQRLGEQLAYYAERQAQNEEAAGRLRLAGLAATVLAAVLGVASSGFQSLTSVLAPWIGVFVTLGAMVVAYGLMDRRQFLAASYGAMADALGRLAEDYGADGALDLSALVTATENLLSSEHAAWSERMLRTIAPPPTVGPSGAAGHS